MSLLEDKAEVPRRRFSAAVRLSLLAWRARNGG
jgi:hypothetical protein